MYVPTAPTKLRNGALFCDGHGLALCLRVLKVSTLNAYISVVTGLWGYLAPPPPPLNTAALSRIG